jgi:hypothetical protein
MPVRDLNGDEVPVGKVKRVLTYHGLAADEAPEWLSPCGEITERKDDIAAGRGELHLRVAEGVAGYNLPVVDPTAHRELRIRTAVRHDVSDSGSFLLGVSDATSEYEAGEWCYYRDSGATTGDGTGSSGHIYYGHDGNASSTGVFGTALDQSGACAIIEFRVRPFEGGVTVSYGGHGRGDTAFESTIDTLQFDMPIQPQLLLDARNTAAPETIHLSTVEFSILHN